MNKASSLVLSWRGKVRNANQFWQLAEYESFAAGEVALYAFLVNECNKFHWQMPFFALPFMFAIGFGCQNHHLNFSNLYLKS